MAKATAQGRVGCLGFLVLVIVLVWLADQCKGSPKGPPIPPPAQLQGGEALVNPAHPEVGTINDNIAKMTRIDHIPSKPWALMGWSQANRLTGYKQLWMPYEYYHSKAECLKARRKNVDSNRGTELATNDATSKCVQIGPETPLKWRMLGMHVTKHKWVELDRFTTEEECETSLRSLLAASPDLQVKCIPLVSKK